MAAVVRTIIICLVLISLTLVIYWRLAGSTRDAMIRELRELNAQLESAVEQREAMIARLSRSHRLAHLQITKQWRDDEGGLRTSVLFIELDDDGRELGRQTFELPGEFMYVDTWTVKFNHERVAQGHPLHGRTLVLLRKVYSEEIAPKDGYAIDTPGAVPPGYAVSEISRLEQQLWSQFWAIAGDPEMAETFGVRAAQGEVVYTKVAEGQLYELTVDAAGGMNLRVIRPEKALSRVTDDVGGTWGRHEGTEARRGEHLSARGS